MPAFHYLVRAVVIDEGALLVAKAKDESNTFLPGGHVEFGENAQIALSREIKEELGLESVIGDFIGAIEHAWPADRQSNHEINLLFDAKIPGTCKKNNPASSEPHLQFYWADLESLHTIDLQPYPLVECLTNDRKAAFWASTV